MLCRHCVARTRNQLNAHMHMMLLCAFSWLCVQFITLNLPDIKGLQICSFQLLPSATQMVLTPKAFRLVWAVWKVGQSGRQSGSQEAVLCVCVCVRDGFLACWGELSPL